MFRRALELRRKAPLTFGLVAACWVAAPAHAYIGPSFLQVPDLAGGWHGPEYNGWVRLEANYWGQNPRRAPPLYEGKSRNYFSGPLAPRSGAGQLTVSVAKDSPAYASLMALCASKRMIPRIGYAESSDRARPPAELGRRPAAIPEYFEYALKDVTIGCPQVAAAPEQALVLRFADIEWRNYAGDGQEVSPSPARLPGAQRSGQSKAYIVHWLWSANSIAPGQCPVMSKPPSEADYYALKSEDETAAKKAEFAPKGGVLATFITGELAKRGPDGLNVSLLPGIVADPGHPGPQIDIARGFDLDGDQGHKPAGRGAQQRSYVSESGKPGIDNQLFTIDGCIKGFGPKGILTVTTTEARRNGETSMMVLISGIDDERQDDSVDVTLFFSRDPMLKSADGEDVLPGYTFRLSEDPQRTPYFQRLKGKIVDGVVLTQAAGVIELDKGRDTTRLFDGRMRLELNPDRTLYGIIGGYQDIYSVANYWGGLTFFETGMGYSMPGVYNALKRAADGLPDPVTGDLTGLSSAFEIKGVEAYIPPEELATLLRTGLAYAK